MQAATRSAIKRTSAYAADESSGETSARYNTAADGGGDDSSFAIVAKKPRKGETMKVNRSSTARDMNDLMDDAIESALSQQQPNESEVDSNAGTNAGTSNVNVQTEIKRLKKLVESLQQQVEFLLSFVGITQPPSSSSTNDSQNVAASNPSSATTSTYAAAAAKGVQKLQGPVREAVLSAVYSDLHARETMKNNVVVYGVPPNPDRSDTALFMDLCQHEYGYVMSLPSVTRVARLGRAVTDRVQPLLVALRDEDDTKRILGNAKFLRDSTDEFTRTNVFISAQQTRAERQAAYEARCRRRQHAAARQQTADRTPVTPILPRLPPTSAVVMHGRSVKTTVVIEQSTPMESSAPADRHQAAAGLATIAASSGSQDASSIAAGCSSVISDAASSVNHKSVEQSGLGLRTAANVFTPAVAAPAASSPAVDTSAGQTR